MPPIWRSFDHLSWFGRFVEHSHFSIECDVQKRAAFRRVLRRKKTFSVCRPANAYQFGPARDENIASCMLHQFADVNEGMGALANPVRNPRAIPGKVPKHVVRVVDHKPEDLSFLCRRYGIERTKHNLSSKRFA